MNTSTISMIIEQTRGGLVVRQNYVIGHVADGTTNRRPEPKSRKLMEPYRIPAETDRILRSGWKPAENCCTYTHDRRLKEVRWKSLVYFFRFAKLFMTTMTIARTATRRIPTPHMMSPRDAFTTGAIAPWTISWPIPLDAGEIEDTMKDRFIYGKTVFSFPASPFSISLLMLILSSTL